MDEHTEKFREKAGMQNAISNLLGQTNNYLTKDNFQQFLKDRLENKYLIEEEFLLDEMKVAAINQLIEENETIVKNEIKEILDSQKSNFEKIWNDIKTEFYLYFLEWLVYSDIIEIVKLEVQYLYIAKIKLDKNFSFTKLRGKYIFYDMEELSFQIDYVNLPSLIRASVKKIEFMLKIFVERNSEWLAAFMKNNIQKNFGIIPTEKQTPLKNRIIRAVNQIRAEKRGRITQEDIAKKMDMARSTLLNHCSKENINLNELIPKK